MSEERKTVLVLAGLIALIVTIYLVFGTKGPSPVTTTMNRLNALKPALIEFTRENGSPPGSLGDLDLPPEAIVDHKGTPFVYEVKGTKVTVSSLGSDGKPGGYMFKADHSVSFDYSGKGD